MSTREFSNYVSKKCLRSLLYVSCIELKPNSKPNTPSRYMSVKEIQNTPTCSPAVKRLFDTESPVGATNVNKLLMRTGKVSKLLFFYLRSIIPIKAVI